jgi:hypothetical protein
VRRKPERVAVEWREDALRRDVIPILAVADDKLSAAEVTERKVLDAPKVALTQQ